MIVSINKYVQASLKLLLYEVLQSKQLIVTEIEFSFTKYYTPNHFKTNNFVNCFYMPDC